MHHRCTITKVGCNLLAYITMGPKNEIISLHFIDFTMVKIISI
jgi:hypothetical protein